MSHNSWDDMRQAKEGSYFEKKNQEALERLARKQNAKRPSPITGEPMEQVNMYGVVIDRCTKSGGIWLDAGELEEILGLAKAGAGKEHVESWLWQFVNALKRD